AGALISNGSTAYYGRCKSVGAIVGRLGAGDASFAAACGTLMRGGTLPETLRYAVAAGTVKVSSLMPYLTDDEAVRDSLPAVEITEVL
ncbi:MAG: hypothetical protein LBM78_02985, partial [Clostridiales bacterium]|nr:hypothetical protein [Clostridiales bacterium]